jgi:hypothetical protein
MGYELVTGFIDHLYIPHELHVITAAPLICIIYKSPQHPLSLFQHAVPASAVPWQWLLSVEILQLPPLHSFLCRLLFRTACQLFPQLNCITISSKPPLQSSTALCTAKPQLSSFIIPSACLGPSLYSLSADPTENNVSNNSSILVCVFVSAGMCLTSRRLAMDVSSTSTIPAFRHHVTIPY